MTGLQMAPILSLAIVDHRDYVSVPPALATPPVGG